MMKQNSTINKFKQYLLKIIDPSGQRESEEETTESIQNNIEFRGANLWILVCAIFIASLGLNVNSTAVIIGAMLISPIMGPIMGIGLGIGVFNFEMVKKAFRNYMIATIAGIITSFLYFTLSPLNDVKSELLARTTPTIYDVMIAFFGGMAGIIAASTKLKKGNVIPGVAIATALMPPLCTAGFGLATGNIHFFLGAFYLYLINSVFIAFATTLGVRLMGFKHVTFVDAKSGARVQRIIYFILIVTMVPSIYLTYDMVKTNVFETNADNFINSEINNLNTFVVKKQITKNRGHREIDLVIVGNILTEKEIMDLEDKLSHYGLNDVSLNIHQYFDSNEIAIETDNEILNLNNMVLQDFYKSNQIKINQQQQEIKNLNERLTNYTNLDSLNLVLGPEIKILFPFINSIAINRTIRSNITDNTTDTVTLVVIKNNTKASNKEEDKFKQWIKTRVGKDQLEFIMEPKLVH